MSLAEHRAFHFYRDCGHRHKSGEFATREVPGLGQMCAAGRVYTLCAACCVESGAQSPACVSEHHDGGCHPCPRRSALEKALQAAGKVVPLEELPDEVGIWRG